MAGHNHITPDQLENERPMITGLARRIMMIAGVIGVVGLIGAFSLGFREGQFTKHFLYSYQVALVYIGAISLGGMFFVLVKHITRSQWSVVVRRIAEIFMANIWVVALFALPLLLGMMGVFGEAYDIGLLYKWAADGPKSELMQHKAPFLNQQFYLYRMLGYFAIWGFIAWFFFGNSLKQDKDGNPDRTRRMWQLSAPGLLLFALSATGFVIDTVMTLDYVWFSTIIGVYFFAGSVITIMSVIGLVVLMLQRGGHMRNAITVEHRHDIGKLMFAFVFFWSYIAFSQYMLYWYGNIPEETAWYLLRQSGEWLPWAWAMAIMHFLIPFAGLLSRYIKRHRVFLAFWAVYLLIVQWMDLYWLIMPNMTQPERSSLYGSAIVPLGLIDLFAFMGVVGIYFAFAAWQASRVPIVPLKDPALAESLKFENVTV